MSDTGRRDGVAANLHGSGMGRDSQLDNVGRPGVGGRALLVGLFLAAAFFVSAFCANGRESLPFLTKPVFLLAACAGLICPAAALGAFLVLLPLSPIIPFSLGVPNFSLAEFALFGVLGGYALRAAVTGRLPSRAGSTATGFLWLFGIVVVCSVALGFARTDFVADPLFPYVLLARISRLPISDPESRGHFLRAGLTLLEALMVYRTLLILGTRDQVLARLMPWLVAAGVAVALVGLAQRQLGFGMMQFWELAEPGRRRINSTWPDTNSCGAYLAACAFLAVGWGQTAQSSVHRFAAWVAVACMAAGAAATGSRAAVIGLVLGAVVFGLASPPRAARTAAFLSRRARGIVAVSLIVALIGSLALSRITPESRSWDYLRHYPNAINQVLKGRVNIWRGGLLLWSEHRVTGIGVGEFYKGLGRYHDPSLVYWNPVHENAHNYFLQIGAELGSAGLLAFLLAIGAAMSAVLRRAGAGNRADDAARARAVLGATTAMVAACVTGHPLLVPEATYWFWALLGLAGASSVTSQPDRAKSRAVRRSPFSRTEFCMAATGIVVLFAGRIAREAPHASQLPMTMGCHPVELDENGNRSRWTEGTAQIVARPNGAVVGLVVADLFAPSRQRTFRIAVEGVGEQSIQLLSTEPQTVEFRLPEPLPAKFRMSIVADRIVNPARDSGGVDDRDFGLRILATNFGLLNRDM